MVLDIYMKSGSIIRVPHVTEYKFVDRGGGISHIHLDQNGKPKILVPTIDLDQIEAVVEVE